MDSARGRRSRSHRATERAPTSFGMTLRRLRMAAGLTQESLAERATLSVRAVSDLERGINRAPQPATLRLLVDALALSADDAALLIGSAVDQAAPAVNSGSVTYLPASLTPMLGRAAEFAAARDLFASEGARLVTITGPGGVGKTRLALDVAVSLQAEYPDGNYFVGLATVRDGEFLLDSIAHTLGLKEGGGQSPFDRIANYLRDKRLLLVLDNFEHLLSEAFVVVNLLTHAPGLTVLVTSRESLHVRGEYDLPVPPLPVPDIRASHDPAILIGVPSVALFCQRARAIHHGFALTAGNAHAVATICARLDGLPLAIELAAASIKHQTPEQLLTRLGRGLPPLVDGPRDLPARQRTMRDTIAWSYEHLTTDEQRRFRHLSVFVAGWTVEAAIAACDDDPDTVSAVLRSLVDKSLIRRIESAAGERYTMLETIREYGAEALAHHGEAEEARRRHAHYFRALAVEAFPHRIGSEQASWLARLDAELGNFRAALQWAYVRAETAIGLELADALLLFWQMRGSLKEGRVWLDQFLSLDAQAATGVPSGIRAAALMHAAFLAYRQNDYVSATRMNEESLVLFRRLGDSFGIAITLNGLGNVATDHGAYGEAALLYEESLALYRAANRRGGICIILNNLGVIAQLQGRYDRALAFLEESLALRRLEDNSFGIAQTLSHLGNLARDQGDTERAVLCHEESLALRRKINDRPGTALSLNYLGIVARYRGEVDRAEELFAESLAIAREIDDSRTIAAATLGLASVAAERGDLVLAEERYTASLARYQAIGYIAGILECADRLALFAARHNQYVRAARLWGAVSALRDRISAPRAPVDRAPYERAIGTVLAALGAEAFKAAHDAGASMMIEQAVASGNRTDLVIVSGSPTSPVEA